MSPALLILVALIVIAASIGGTWLLWTLAASIEPQYFARAPGPPAEPKCSHCGYGLYFAENQRCPECGEEFDMRHLDMRLAEWDGKILRPKERQET